MDIIFLCCAPFWVALPCWRQIRVVSSRIPNSSSSFIFVHNRSTASSYLMWILADLTRVTGILELAAFRPWFMSFCISTDIADVSSHHDTFIKFTRRLRVDCLLKFWYQVWPPSKDAEWNLKVLYQTEFYIRSCCSSDIKLLSDNRNIIFRLSELRLCVFWLRK